MRDGWEPELLQVPVQRISHMMPAVQSGCPPKMFPVGRGEKGNSQLWTALAWRAVLSCWAGEPSLLLSALGPARSYSKHPALQNHLVLLLLPALLSVLYLLSEGWTERREAAGEASLWSWCWGLLSPTCYRYFSLARFSFLPWKQAKLTTLKVAAIASYFMQQFHETWYLHHFMICLLGSSGWTEGKQCLWSITSKERLQLFRRELVPCCCMIVCGWPADKLSTTNFVTRMALLSGTAPSAPPPIKKDICWVTLVL